MTIQFYNFTPHTNTHTHAFIYMYICMYKYIRTDLSRLRIRASSVRKNALRDLTLIKTHNS